MAFTKDGVDLNVCAYCNTTIDDLSRTVDHLYPKSRGGILSNKNKVPACGDCNKLKSNMNIKEFERALSAMIFLEQTNHKKRMSYLKKVRINTIKLIDKLNGDKKEHRLRHSSDRSRPSSVKKKKRP